MTKKNVNTAVKKCYKRSSVAEDLINNPICAAKYELQTFKILRQCLNNFNLVWLEAILINLNKPELFKNSSNTLLHHLIKLYFDN